MYNPIYNQLKQINGHNWKTISPQATVLIILDWLELPNHWPGVPRLLGAKYSLSSNRWWPCLGISGSAAKSPIVDHHFTYENHDTFHFDWQLSWV
jgi:hypothetical protein